MRKVLEFLIVAILLFLPTIIIICKLDGNTMCKNYYREEISQNSKFYTYKNYCIFPYMRRNELEYNIEISERITLALHISYDNLNINILEQLKSWDGPITLMIAIPTIQVYRKMQTIRHTLGQFPSEILYKLSVHILFRSENGCEKNVVDELNETESAWNYPINVVRNAARMFVRSKYIILSDSEFVFPHMFESKMHDLAQNQLMRNPKTALVVRIFEVNKTIKQMPRNKTELRKLFLKGLATEFHAYYNKEAHSIPQLDQWFNKQEDTGKITINSILKFSKRDWEPQFVSLNTMPFHDEHFPFSLHDNTVLRWEMCRQNYTFALVNDLFMVHRGVKTMQDLPRIKRRQKHSWAQFNIAMKLFKRRMDQQYPETRKACPNFGA